MRVTGTATGKSRHIAVLTAVLALAGCTVVDTSPVGPPGDFAWTNGAPPPAAAGTVPVVPAGAPPAPAADAPPGSPTSPGSPASPTSPGGGPAAPAAGASPASGPASGPAADVPVPPADAPLPPTGIVQPPADTPRPPAGGDATLPVDPATPVGQAIAHLNGIRAGLGLGPIGLDARLTKGAENHAEYLRLNVGHPAIAGLKAHTEDPSLPGSTPEGREGAGELISWGTPKEAIDGLLGTLYHRIPLVRPETTAIAIGARRDERSAPVVVRFGFGTGPSTPYPGFYPYNGQTDVPLDFGGELPSPIPDDATYPVGYPITFIQPESAKLTGFSGTLVDGAGREVPCWVSSPERLARAGWEQPGTVCLIPRKPLKHSTTYAVSVTGSVDGQPAKTWRWLFDTVKAIDIHADDAGALDAADGRIAWVSGRITWASGDDDDPFMIFESPHERQVTVMLNKEVWAQAKAALGITRADQLTGKYMRILGKVDFVGETFINVGVLDGTEVQRVANPPKPPEVDAADVAALDGAVGKVAAVTGKVTYAKGTDGDAFWTLASPHKRQVTVMLSTPVWQAARKALGLSDAAQLTGKTVRTVAVLTNVGETYLNVNVGDGADVTIVK